MVDRNAVLLGPLGRSSRFIEVGAGFSPIVPKASGYNTMVVDHAPRAGLAAKYATADVDVGRIEDVDVIWREGPLHDAFPKETLGAFDGLIASHVIEHIPDIVAFLASAALLLHSEGILALAVPDKRLCFDCFRPASTTGQVLAAYAAHPMVHSPAALFDSVAYFTRPEDGRLGWERGLSSRLVLDGNFEQALAQLRAAADADNPREYVDAHGWVFTPASFELLILELGEAAVIDWRIEHIEECPGVEFLARLTRGRLRFPSVMERELRRSALLRRILLEIREQTDWLLDDNSNDLSLASIDARVDALAATVHAIANAAAPAQTSPRPAHAVWQSMLPLRRAIARWRGRIS